MDWPSKRLHSFKERLDYVLRYQCDMTECLATWAQHAARLKGKLGGGPRTEKVMLDNGLSLGDANGADEGVKKERNSKMY